MPRPRFSRLAVVALLLAATGWLAFRYWGVPGTLVLVIVVVVLGWGLSRAVRS